MKREHEKELLEIVKKLESLDDNFSTYISALEKPMKEMKEAVQRIETLATEAEQEGEIEVLKAIFHQVMPFFDELDATYQSIYLSLEATKTSPTRKNLNEARKLCASFNEFVHIVVDSTANTGDYILGRCTRLLVEKTALPDVDWKIQHVINRVDEHYIDMCNRSKGIVIGGGGLLLKDTNPNSFSGWTWPCPTELLKKIEKPIYVLGIGYNRFRGQADFDECFTESINTLVEKSAFFGLRNHGSMRAVKKYLREELHDKVKFHPCATTVLAKLRELPERRIEEPFVAVNFALDRGTLRYGKRLESIVLSIVAVVAELSKCYKIKVYVQCKGDEQIAAFIRRAEVPCEVVTLTTELTEEEYMRHFTEPELVLATRGHAQMIPFGCKTPVISIISHDKLAWFLEDINHPEWGIDIEDEAFGTKLLEKAEYMLQHREEICLQIEKAQEELWEIMQENMKCITI